MSNQYKIEIDITTEYGDDVAFNLFKKLESVIARLPVQLNSSRLLKKTGSEFKQYPRNRAERDQLIASQKQKEIKSIQWQISEAEGVLAQLKTRLGQLNEPDQVRTASR